MRPCRTNHREGRRSVSSVDGRHRLAQTSIRNVHRPKRYPTRDRERISSDGLGGDRSRKLEHVDLECANGCSGPKSVRYGEMLARGIRSSGRTARRTVLPPLRRNLRAKGTYTRPAHSSVAAQVKKSVFCLVEEFPTGEYGQANRMDAIRGAWRRRIRFLRRIDISYSRR